ncbi:MAG: 50S ribosomal protein L23 [Chitinophagales bacterium]|nr:50S ribosomal protein L23 [Chitinophagales bacterium]
MSKKHTDILLKPVVTEKSNTLSENLNRYTFVVAKGANKLQIKAAVESMYGVAVAAVNTMNVAGKDKSRFTTKGLAKGYSQSVKKAVVTLNEGETIDFYSNI